MHDRLRIVNIAVLVMILTLAGCAYMTRYPRPTEGFIQKPYYQVSYNEAWDTVLEVLGEERVGAVYQAKEKGKIITGYFTKAKEGEGVQKRARWSYTITFKQLSENSTKIDIVCKLEQYYKGWGLVAYEWHDINDKPGYEKIAHSLETWLYEKIEKKNGAMISYSPFSKTIEAPAQKISNINNIDYSKYSESLVKGKTTKQAVEKDLGKPTEQSYIGEYEYWAYYYRKPSPNVDSPAFHRLTLKYDNKGILYDFRNVVLKQ